MMLFVLILCLIMMWLVFNYRTSSSIKFSNGKIVKESGKFPPGFRAGLSDIAQRSNMTGTVWVRRKNGQAVVKFSSSIPDNIQQRIRNVFPYNELGKNLSSNKHR